MEVSSVILELGPGKKFLPYRSEFVDQRHAYLAATSTPVGVTLWRRWSASAALKSHLASDDQVT